MTCLKNKFTELYLFALVSIIMGIFEIIMYNPKANTAEGLLSGIYLLFVGVGLFVWGITSHVKYRANRKQMDREMSKEYDERDDIIEGKASQFTMRLVMLVTLLMMFLTNWYVIPTDTVLILIIICCAGANLLAKKYYNHVL
ncbi:hypothetical protein ACFQZR_16995 [Paenibacillus sp. GCM10027629]|uniref:hypothetical protein n=1 Tax=Paenibacillus sp. GCM10027629 TaxID=3273414 RepID=UPI00363CE477